MDPAQLSQRLTTHEEAKKGVTLLFTNHYGASDKHFLTHMGGEGEKQEALHSLGRGLVCFIKGVLSFEEHIVQQGLDNLVSSKTLAQPLTTANHSSLLTKIWSFSMSSSPPPPPQWVMAEHDLIMADASLMSSVLFLLQESYASYLKAALSLRESYNTYTAVRDYLVKAAENPKDKSSSDLSLTDPLDQATDRLDLYDGVAFGLGVFNLIVSLLPEKILGVAKFFGFEGDREKALHSLNECVHRGGLRSPLAGLLLLTYHTVLASFFSIPDANLAEASEILNILLKRYPNSALFLWMGGKIARIEGKLPEALDQYTKALDAQKTSDEEEKKLHENEQDIKEVGGKQFQHLCIYELGWCYLLSQRFEEAEAQFSLLLLESKWSKSTNAYLAAVSNFHSKNYDQATVLFKTIPQLLEKGNKAEVEVFVSRRTKRYLDSSSLPEEKRLFYPIFELIYFWNGYSELGSQGETILKEFERIEEEIKSLNETQDKWFSFEDTLILALCKASLLKNMNKEDQAVEELNKILKNENQIKEEKYLIPYAKFDLARIEISKGNKEEAKTILKPLKDSHYTGYDFETRLQYRITSVYSSLKK